MLGNEKQNLELVSTLKKFGIISEKNQNNSLALAIIANGINGQDKNGYTALHYAVENGNLNAVKELLRFGAKCQIENLEQMNALHFAAMHNKADIILLLLQSEEFRKNLKAKDLYKRTALDLALEYESNEAIKLLWEIEHPEDDIRISRFSRAKPNKIIKKIEDLPKYGMLTPGSLATKKMQFHDWLSEYNQGIVIQNLLVFLDRKSKEHGSYLKSAEEKNLLENEIKGLNREQVKLTKKIEEIQKKITATTKSLKEKPNQNLQQQKNEFERQLESVQKEINKINIKLKHANEKLQKIITSSDIINKNGICNALAFLWHIYPRDEFYAFLYLITTWSDIIPGRGLNDSLSNLPIPASIKARYKGKTRRDLFNDLINAIVIFQFSGSSKLTQELQLTGWEQSSRKDQLALLQHDESQMEITPLFAESKWTLNIEQLTELLIIFSKWPGMRIDLGSFGEKGGHAVSLYVNPKGIFEYYDPNDPELTKTFNIKDCQKLAQYHFSNAKKFGWVSKEGNLQVSFNTFKLYNKKAEKPLYEKAQDPPLVPVTSKNGFTKLHYAVMSNDINTIKEHISNPLRYYDLYKTDAHGHSVLELARILGFNYKEVLNEVEAAKNKNIELKKNFLLAIETENIESMNQILDMHPDLVFDISGEELITPLQIALQSKNSNIILAILRRKDCLITEIPKSRFISTSLTQAIEFNAGKEIITLLIEQMKKRQIKFDINLPDRGMSYLSSAIKHHADVETLNYLLDLGANPRTTEKDLNMTPLMYAFQNSANPEIIERLLSKSDFQAKDMYGKTALMYALQYRADIKIINKLLKESDLKVRDWKNKTLLMYALQYKAEDKVISDLIEKSELTDVDAQGYTALMCALANNASEAIVEQLLTKSNLNAVGEGGVTIFMHALRYGNEALINKLIKNDLDKNIDYTTALEYILNDADDNSDKVKIVLTLLKYIKHLDDDIILEALKSGTASKEIINALIQKAPPFSPTIIKSLHQLFRSNVDTSDHSDILESLLKAYKENHSDINFPINEQNQTLLMYALENNLDPIILKRLAKESDVMVQDDRGKTALMYAIENKASTEIIDEIALKTDLSVIDLKGKTALMYALENGANKIVAILADKSNLNTSDKKGNTILEYALKYDADKEFVIRLLLAGATVGKEGSNGKSRFMAVLNLLHFEAEKEVLSTLIKLDIEGVDDFKDYQDEDGKSVLMYALQNHAPREDIERLLEKGCKIDVKDNQGKTPLMIALEFHASSEVINLLVEKEALLIDKRLIDHQDLLGKSSLMYAFQYHASKDVIDTLVKNGARIDISDNKGKSILKYALRYKEQHIEIIDRLLSQKSVEEIAACFKYALKHKASKNIVKRLMAKLGTKEIISTLKDSNEKTPLMHALEYNCEIEIIRELLIRGSNVNAQDENGNTALMLAITRYNLYRSQANIDIIKLLLSFGANAKINNKKGNTVFSVAQGNPEILALLPQRSSRHWPYSPLWTPSSASELALPEEFPSPEALSSPERFSPSPLHSPEESLPSRSPPSPEESPPSPEGSPPSPEGSPPSPLSTSEESELFSPPSPPSSPLSSSEESESPEESQSLFSQEKLPSSAPNSPIPQRKQSYTPFRHGKREIITKADFVKSMRKLKQDAANLEDILKLEHTYFKDANIQKQIKKICSVFAAYNLDMINEDTSHKLLEQLMDVIVTAGSVSDHRIERLYKMIQLEKPIYDPSFKRNLIEEQRDLIERKVYINSVISLAQFAHDLNKKIKHPAKNDKEKYSVHDKEAITEIVKTLKNFNLDKLDFTQAQQVLIKLETAMKSYQSKISDPGVGILFKQIEHETQPKHKPKSH